MSALRVFKISDHFRRNVNFFPKRNVSLTPKNFIFLSQVFLSSVNETCNGFLNYNLFSRNYYRQYLLSNSKFENLIFSEHPKTITKTGEILNQLKQEGEDDLKLRNQLSEHLNEELSQFSFDELCQVKFLVQEFVIRNKGDPSWETILENINGECFNRIPSWTVDEITKVAYISMRVPKFSNIKKRLMNKLVRRSLTNEQIIVLFYFFHYKKYEIPKEKSFDMEKKVLSIFPDVNIIEIGIIAEGFANSFSSIHIRDIIHYLSERVVDEKETIDRVPFNSISKFLQVFSNFKDLEKISEFQEKAVETALKFGTRELIHLASISENISWLNPNLSTVLMKEVKDHITELTVFYIERVTFINTKLNIRDEEFLNLAVGVFESINFAQNIIRSVLFLSHLMHHQMYPKKLLDLALEQQVADLAGKGMSTKCLWWFIYCSLELEKPEYLTIDLDPKIRKKLCILSNIQFNLNFPRHKRILWEAYTILAEVYGEEMVNFFRPLPHYPYGLLMRADKNLKLQKLPQDLEYHNKGFVIKPLQDDYIWIFIYFQYHKKLLNLKTEHSLTVQTQVRQLKSVGYTPILVHDIKKENEREHLESLINAKLEECCKGQKDAITS